MFTGIVEATAEVASVRKTGAGAVLALRNPWKDLPKIGASICVSGACLTVISANAREISFNVSPETLEKTTLSHLRPADTVNLERALAVGDDISGHFVTGHVDGVGCVSGLEKSGGFARLAVEAPEELAVYLVEKGSVAVNGVSLTVASLRGAAFECAMIPETLSRTDLSKLSPGDPVNVEADILAKHVVRYLSLSGGKPGDLSPAKLEQWGY